jgi:hypothetical protein
MGDNEGTTPTTDVDDQEIEVEADDQLTAAALRRRAESAKAATVAAPVDDDVIIK